MASYDPNGEAFKRAQLLEKLPGNWSHKRGKLPNRGNPVKVAWGIHGHDGLEFDPERGRKVLDEAKGD